MFGKINGIEKTMFAVRLYYVAPVTIYSNQAFLFACGESEKTSEKNKVQYRDLAHLRNKS